MPEKAEDVEIPDTKPSLRELMQTSVDGYRKLVEELERYQTGIAEVTKATAEAEVDIVRLDEMNALKNVQLNSMYEEVKASQRSIERMSHGYQSSKEQHSNLERQLRLYVATTAAEKEKRDKAVADTEQLIARAMSAFDSAEWAVDQKRHVKAVTALKTNNNSLQAEIDQTAKTNAELRAFINEQTQLPWEEVVVYLATMRLENEAVWKQVQGHHAVVARFEKEEADAARSSPQLSDSSNESLSDEGANGPSQAPNPVIPTVTSPCPRVPSDQQKESKPADPFKTPLPLNPPQQFKLPLPVNPSVPSHEKQQNDAQPVLDRPTETQTTSNVSNPPDLSIPSTPAAVHFAPQLEMDQLNDSEMSESDAGVEVNASQTSMVAQCASQPMSDPLNESQMSESDLGANESAQSELGGKIDGDPLNESQNDVGNNFESSMALNESQMSESGGNFLAMFGNFMANGGESPNSSQTVSKDNGKDGASFGFGFGGMDNSTDGNKSGDSSVPFSLFGF